MILPFNAANILRLYSKSIFQPETGGSVLWPKSDPEHSDIHNFMHFVLAIVGDSCPLHLPSHLDQPSTAPQHLQAYKRDEWPIQDQALLVGSRLTLGSRD
jgi:hypothetical protein